MQLENPTKHEGLQAAGTRLGAHSFCNHLNMYAMLNGCNIFVKYNMKYYVNGINT